MEISIERSTRHCEGPNEQHFVHEKVALTARPQQVPQGSILGPLILR